MSLSTINRKSATRQAAELILKNGSMKLESLFAQVHFGTTNRLRKEAFQRSMDQGWLRLFEGVVSLTTAARSELIEQGTDLPVELIGKIAASRDLGNVYDRPPLKYRTNSRGDDRRQIDEQFQRGPGFHLFTVS